MDLSDYLLEISWGVFSGRYLQVLCKLAQAASMEVLKVWEWTMITFNCIQLKA